MIKYFLLLLLFLFSSENILSQEIIIRKKDAEVWGTSQLIQGKLNGFYTTGGTLTLNNTDISFNLNPQDSSFNVPVELGEGENIIIISAVSGGLPVLSDTLRLTLAYNIRPDVFAYPIVAGREISLISEILENPGSETLNFSWSADLRNPLPVVINNFTEPVASVSFSPDAPFGEYYFDLLVTNTSGDSAKARTFVTVLQNEIKAFDIRNDYAAWIDSSIIYEITPYIFTSQGNFNRITEKIPDIVRLGINTIWLQPVYSTHYRGQGYDVTNYFKVRTDLGSEADLRNLIATAKAAGLKVLFDFVPNHSSIQHRYAQQSIQFGMDSHYWDFYQREPDDAPYSQHYTFYQGFINYFWDNLPNLNYNNPEVRKWITEAAKYWIEHYDIDGYRFDAVWGVTARNPQFTKDLRLALKRIKPEIMMLAEDKASQPQVFDERFDVAFDWAPGYGWVSQWMWQTNYDPNSNPTIFNSGNLNQRSNLLRNAITNNNNGYAPGAKILRFTDNNDHFYFITHHGVERTRMVGTLLFTLHGVPLIYNGQEIGKSGHPYSTSSIFQLNQPIDYNDPNNLFPYYQKLIRYKKTLPALYRDNYSEISVSPSGYIFGFRRWFEDQNIFTVINMSGSVTNVTITLPLAEIPLDSSKIYFLTDLIGGTVISGIPGELQTLNVSMAPFSSSVYLLADSAIFVSVEDDKTAGNIPTEFYVSQNYPNPFNPATIISFNLPEEGHTEVIVYDVLGGKIATLINGIKPAGNNKVEFDASGLSTGIYFYRVNYKDRSIVKKMLLVK
jgi:cyclomaltodextrinase / maltogenic alpha-amylase / neopullulanase